MIEISHRQAQRLIRQRIDGPIPDEQWAILQAHLEGCEECQAYQAGLHGSERSLRRVLRLRWSPVHGPRRPLETNVKSRRASRAQVRKFTSYAALVAVVVFLGVLYAGYRRATAPPPTPTPDLASLRLTLTPAPTRAVTTFRGVTAYVADERGSPEIFLLNSGVASEESELVNMTNDPAADTFPAWSPDGEWLAFLSDRTGKNEVFVVHVAGSRLTQLTNDPGVQWRGPLSWSRDGAWIALTGIPVYDEGTQNEDSWVYLVPVGSSMIDARAGPRKLGLTRGSAGPARFSPADPILAYAAADQSSGGIVMYDVEEGRFFLATLADSSEGLLRTGTSGAFDWSDDGRLAYLAEGPVDPATGVLSNEAGTQARTTLSPAQFGGGPYDSESNQLIESLPGAGTIRRITYLPGREGRGQTVAYLLDEDADGCWTVTLHLVLERDASPRTLPGLCVDGDFSRESFTPDGRWLVATGHLPGEPATSAVYALRIPADLTSTEPDVVERLADVDGAAETSQPVIRPAGMPRNISPRAVAQPRPALEPAIPARNTRGQVVYSLIQNQTYRRAPLVTIRPDGSSARTLPADAQPGEHAYSCPAVAPDGTQIAFLSDRESGNAGLNEVFVMDADGENARRVARNVFARTATQASGFDCPIWSPDGTRLVSVLRGDSSDQLAVIPLAEDAAVTYLPVALTSTITLPVWSPDGARVLLTHHREAQTSPRITVVDLGDSGDAAAGDSATTRTLVESDGWGDVYGAAYSPDGRRIAYIVAYNRANLPTELQLRMIDSSGGNPINLGSLGDARMRGWIGRIPVVWDEDNRISFLMRMALHDKWKSQLFLINLNSSLDGFEMHPIAILEDVAFDAAWSPDRRWVMFTTEAGLISVQVEGTIQGESDPARINSEGVLEVDWR